MHGDAGTAPAVRDSQAGPNARARGWVFTSRLRTVGPGLLVLGGWLAYTRMYFVLHPLGLTFAPSVFMRLTGHPDPACGLTRTFAWMWRGEVVTAAKAYPLGPLLFVLAVAQVADSLVALFTGRRLSLERLRPYRRPLIALGVGALAINWTLKLVWLGI